MKYVFIICCFVFKQQTLKPACLKVCYQKMVVTGEKWTRAYQWFHLWSLLSLSVPAHLVKFVVCFYCAPKNLSEDLSNHIAATDGLASSTLGFFLNRISHIKLPNAENLVHEFVTQRLDHSKSPQVGCLNASLNSLQLIQCLVNPKMRQPEF